MVLGFQLIVQFMAKMVTGDGKEGTVRFGYRKWLGKWVRVVGMEEIWGNGLCGN